MAKADDDLHGQVGSIVDELEAAVSGSLYEIDGEFKILEDLDAWKEEQYREKADAFIRENDGKTYDVDRYDSFEEYMENEIGTVEDIDEPDQVSLDGYICDRSLGDVRFEVDESKEVLGGKILFCYGGPNIWVADDEVRGYWGSSRTEMSLDSMTRSAMLSWFRERWDVVSR